MSNAITAVSLMSPKLQRWHLDRKAIVYVRQSTPQQVLENRESTERQYALVDRAVAFGWSRDQVDVIDDDQGMSGQSVDGRLGFQRLLAEVSLDRVGLVLGLEMSRLARSCKDWHQLLELCGIFRTLLGDQDGLYDPTEFNDRLLLGLKGTMSEAELHVLKGRMYQGRINKAKRGELLVHPPIGYVLNADKTSFEFDPDSQAQETIRLIFAEFNRQETIYSLLKYLAQNDIRLPVRPRYGPNRNQLQWHRPHRATLAGMLHHPTYAGAYRYGQHRTDPRKKIAGRRRTDAVRVPLEESLVLIKDRFPAYITWEQFEKNQQQLEKNRNRAKSMGSPREGPSLLGGLVYSGRCGARLMVTYSGRAQRLRYQCARSSQNNGEPLCLGIVGHDLDRFVTKRVFTLLQPASLELSLAATDDLEQERQRLDQHWRQRLERSAYEADRAERQFQAVEPENRLVGRTLEKKWEAALRDHQRCESEYDDFKRTQPSQLTAQQRELVKKLSQDIPAIWEAQATTPQERQKIVRQLIDRIEIDIDGNSERTDITLTWAGGFTSHHRHNRTVISYAQLSDLDGLLARIVELKKENKTLGQVAEQLNREGYRSVRRCPFTAGMLSRLLSKQGISLPCRSARNSDALRENEWWLTDLAKQLDMPATSLNNWRMVGWVKGRKLPGLRGRWILWADDAEVERLKQLRNERRRWSDCPYPEKLTTPNLNRTDASSS